MIAHGVSAIAALRLRVQKKWVKSSPADDCRRASLRPQTRWSSRAVLAAVYGFCRVDKALKTGPNLMVLLLARVIGIGIETADMLVKEILSRNLRDRRAVARYAGLTGSPDESGKKRREKGLARSGNARVRKGMIQLAWRFLNFQKESALAKWFRARTENAQKDDRRARAQAPHRLVALRPAWRCARGRDPASCALKGVRSLKNT
jgi:Transposase IS116/IS110/IS902 family